MLEQTCLGLGELRNVESATQRIVCCRQDRASLTSPSPSRCCRQAANSSRKTSDTNGFGVLRTSPTPTTSSATIQGVTRIPPRDLSQRRGFPGGGKLIAFKETKRGNCPRGSPSSHDRWFFFRGGTRAK